MKQLHGPNIDINNADVFTMQNEYSYAAFVGVLSNIFMKAHVSSSFRSSPYNAALVISPSMTKPYKKQPESSFTRLQYVVSKMIQPAKGIKLGIFVSESDVFDQTTSIGLKHTVSQCWPLDMIQQEKTIITINLPPKQLVKGENKVRYFERVDLNKALTGRQVKFVDYNTPIEVLFSQLQSSKVHLSYQGGSAWISICLGVPTIVIHPQLSFTPIHLKYKLFGQDLGNINILNKQRKVVSVRTHPQEHHTNLKNLRNKIQEVTK